MKVLLTGGTGFVATHCIDALLAHGHTVVTTVRSAAKGEQLLKAYDGGDSLSYCVVPDIVGDGAFDSAVQSDPPFGAVLHTASPFHYTPVDVDRDLINPAVKGTKGILQSIHRHAPSVKKVVITSSFAAVISPNEKKATYTANDWNPVTLSEAYSNNVQAYRASKTFAEKAAWDFVDREKPGFSLSTMCPPLILGPVKPSLSSLDNINTSNERMRDILQGKMKEQLQPTAAFYWVDVRDVALAHVLALKAPNAAGRRYILTQGSFCNADVARAAIKNFPDLGDKFPAKLESDMPADLYSCDTQASKEILGLQYRPLEETVVDSIKSLKAMGL